jgi:uncharacterized protein YjiS (DUF1127 family)
VSDQVSTLFAFSGSRKSTKPRLGLLHRLALMWEVHRTRRILAEMDPRQLKDIGISRSEAQAEFNRTLWDFELRR